MLAHMQPKPTVVDPCQLSPADVNALFARVRKLESRVRELELRQEP